MRNLRGEAWKATELVQMVRKHQPHVLIDNRLRPAAKASVVLLPLSQHISAAILQAPNKSFLPRAFATYLVILFPGNCAPHQQ